MKNEKWTFPAEIELEYKIPEGSDAVKEVAKCLHIAKKRWRDESARLGPGDSGCRPENTQTMPCVRVTG